MCPLDCPDTCSLDVTVEKGRVTRLDGNRRNPLTDGFICGKVRDYAEHVYHAERLTTPLVREVGSRKGEGRFRAVDWHEALDLIVTRFRMVREHHGAEAILPCSYGGSNGKFTHDSADAAFFRRLGASRMHRGLCAAATSAALGGLYGGMPGIPLTDYGHARLIVVWGANPHASGIHFVPVVKRAQEAGARLIVVDPRETKLARMADLHVPLRPGTDLPVALALIRWFFEQGRADEGFLAEFARGADELRRRAEPWTLERAAVVAGVGADMLEAFARMYEEESPAALRCGWGPERNRNGCSAIAAILALPAVAGKFGVKGGGFTLSNGKSFPLGAIADDPEPGTRVISSNRLGRALLEERDPPVKALFVYNCNPLSTFPDQERVRRGFLREDLFTVVFEQVMTDSAHLADVVLPATTFLEHAELRNGYGAFALQYAEPVIAPVGGARPNYEVFAELIERLELSRRGDDFTPLGMLRRAVADPGAVAALRDDGLVLPPCGAHPVQFVDLFPRTPDGLIDLVPEALEREGDRPLYAYREDPGDERFPLALISPCTEKQISASLGELLLGEQPVGLHPDDARARDVREGDTVRVWNELGEVVTAAHLDPHLRPGVACLPKGLWSRHTRNGATSNALAPDTLTDRAGGACYNDARVQIARV